MKFYKCRTCNKLILNDDFCCDDKIEIFANTEEASLEKHIPFIIENGENIEVVIGEVEHPMIEEHYISHIIQVTENETNIVELTNVPKATFKNQKSTIYAYCNLHGLWKKDI